MRALLIAALLASSGVVHAQRGEPGGGPRGVEFSALDRNRDGYVTRIEALADQEIHKRFAQFDANKDRQLSLAEYLAAREDIDKRVQQDAVLTARVKAALLAERGIRRRQSPSIPMKDACSFRDSCRFPTWPRAPAAWSRA